MRQAPDIEEIGMDRLCGGAGVRGIATTITRVREAGVFGSGGASACGWPDADQNGGL